MTISKRAIPQKKLPFLIIFIFFIIALLIFAFWQWNEVKKDIQRHGPSIIQQRLNHVLGREVTLSRVSISFPTHMSLYELTIFAQNGTDTIFEAPRLEIDWAFFSLLTGKIRPKTIKIIAPRMNIYRTASGVFNFGTNKSAEKAPKTFYPGAKLVNVSLKTTNSPLNINPNSIEIIDGRAHLEDEQDKFPQLDGNFDLYIKRHPSQNELAIISSQLTLRSTAFFYHGIQGELSGATDLNRNNISSNWDVALSENGHLKIHGKMNNYNKVPKCSFEITADSFDLRNLALIKFPLLNLPKGATLNGSFKSKDTMLYGNKFESLSASILLNNGKWRLDAIDLTLNQNSGKINGSIIPESHLKGGLAKASLLYQGNVAPNLQVKDLTINELTPSLWQTPITINSDLTIDLSTYPIQITEMKLTSNNGDLFAQGSIDLFSGFAQMEGTYLKTTSSKKNNGSAKKLGDNAVNIVLAGNISSPDISIPSSEK